MIGKLIDWVRGETAREKAMKQDLERLRARLRLVTNEYYDMEEQLYDRGQTIHQLERKLGKRNRKSARQHRRLFELNRALRISDSHQLAELSAGLWELHSEPAATHAPR